MAELTHSLRRALMTTLAATGIAAIAITTVACAPVSSGTDSSDDASASSDTSADADATSASPTESTDSSDSGASDDAADAKGAGSSVGTLPSNKVLPKEMSGQEAIDALGDKIEVVAKRVGKTPDELKELLLRDKSAHVTPDGNVLYRD